MDQRKLTGYSGGTERGRSPSGVPPEYPVAPTGEGHEAAGHTPADFPCQPPEPQGSDRDHLLPLAPAESDLGDRPAEPEPAKGDYEEIPRAPRFLRRSSMKRVYRKPKWEPATHTPQERLLLLDTWRRSALPAGDFASLVGVSKHTLYAWKKRFDRHGPAGLLDQARGAPRGSRLPELTRRAILMLKESNPDWGCERISGMLLRGPALPASPAAVARVLHEAGFVVAEEATRPHPQKPRQFERQEPNELWQTDIFTFVLKRQNRRVYLVAFMDDHSRFIVSYGVSTSPSSAWVIAVLRSAVASYLPPKEILSDNGPQYVTWRGRSAFSRELQKQGIRHIVARPRHPQTLGKIERFWGSLWRECVQRAVFLDLPDAQRRIGWYIDGHNFQRPHQGIGGLVPADRFFAAAPEVLRTLKERAAANALELARHGAPRSPFYLTGSAGGQLFSVHTEGERVILRRGEGDRQEIELTEPDPAGLPAAESTGAAETPEPLCPTALPMAEDDFPVPEPGVCAIDQLVPPGDEEPPVPPPSQGDCEQATSPEPESPEEGGDDDATVSL